MQAQQSAKQHRDEAQWIVDDLKGSNASTTKKVWRNSVVIQTTTAKYWQPRQRLSKPSWTRRKQNATGQPCVHRHARTYRRGKGCQKAGNRGVAHRTGSAAVHIRMERTHLEWRPRLAGPPLPGGNGCRG